MENYIRNKQVGIDDIRRLAKSFEDYAANFIELGKETKAQEDEFEKIWDRKVKEFYDGDIIRDDNTVGIFQQRDRAEREMEFKYSNMSTEVEYTIRFDNGKKMTEKGYEWFEAHTENPKTIVSIYISMWISFSTKEIGTDKKIYKNIHSSCDFDGYSYDDQTFISYNVSTDCIEEENDKVHRMIEDNFASCPIRYNNTIKYRNLRIQAFSIAVGVILSYILFIILKLSSGSLPDIINQMLGNKNIIVFGQWVSAIILGNILASWYILLLYKPLLPKRSYVGYDRSSRKSIYRDNVEDFIDGSEVRIRKFFDADIRREKIEKLYKIGRIALLVQLVISVLLFLILK